LYNKATVNVGKPTQTPILPHHGYLWYLGLLGIVAMVGVALVVFASAVFRRREGDFAEAL
jgi:hypothetical protein